jgi:hypothetical protein
VSRKLRLLALLLVLVLLVAPQGCVSVGRASFAAYQWGGETFMANPVSLIPYWVGFVAFGLVGVPLWLVSWPATAIFFPGEKEEPSREFFWFSALSPSIFLGTGGGTILGGIFYPFGIPFMSDKKDWNDEKAPPDDEPLPPPPGGDRPPEKSPPPKQSK